MNGTQTSQVELEYILKLGREIRGKYRKGNPVGYCNTNTWINAEIIEGRFYLYPDSDSVIIAGILALIKEKNDGKIFDEINLACIDYSILPEYIVDFLTKLETELCKIKPK